MQREQNAKLGEIRLHRRLHVRVLQLHREPPPVMGCRPMHLAERGGGRGLVLELGELGLPLRPQLRRHAPPHEGPAHGRGLALQLAKLRGVFRRQRLGDGGEQLRHLHDRPLEAAERRGQRRGILVPLRIEPE